jgi:membrane associated rhomboid family serine protease
MISAEPSPKLPQPYINLALLGLIFMVYAWELSLGLHMQQAALLLGFTPHNFTGYFHSGQMGFATAILPLFSSLFLHGNVLHLVPNVLFLFIFGGIVEETLGHGRYLLFFLASGVGANLIYLCFAPHSTIPLIGASGAIAGVMAANFSLSRGLRLTHVFIIVWILLQFAYAIFASIYRVAGQAGMAWWAHVGGFILGLVLIRFLVPEGIWLIPLHTKKGLPPEN